MKRRMAACKDGKQLAGAVNLPLGTPLGPLDRIAPLNEAAFLADVDLLPAADQSEHHAPVTSTVREVNEQFGFRLAAAVAGRLLVLFRHLLRVVRALGFIEDEHVLDGSRLLPTGVLLHVLLHAPHERLAATSGRCQLVLEHLNERSVS